MHITFSKLKNFLIFNFSGYSYDNGYGGYDNGYWCGDGDIGWKGTGNNYFCLMYGTAGYIDGDGQADDQVFNFREY